MSTVYITVRLRYRCQVCYIVIMLKPSGHRLDDKHNSIIRKWSKRWKVKEAASLRMIVIMFDQQNNYETFTTTGTNSKRA